MGFPIGAAVVAGISLMAKQYVKRKAHKELVKKRYKDSNRTVDASIKTDAQKHGQQNIKGLVKALKDPKSEAYKTMNMVVNLNIPPPPRT